ncbi:ABC transporter substrate-binding protein [Chitinimonas sp. BJB300]|uniref:ABC transporter substrate-binding protein n=1 Tax=Chitinimonas sp. BJB300 TaxID=1559339 RepID=UPI000C10856F|nr:ABC transporter substrate-binding protein [Chitinimonas sp. BJB300]PHV11059.1 iron ABC transporter substrate-binding protein [Chitinimonas sp. BJB300]TSJ90087.1 ABC transporter substrate-binding protein [Chitinimonas sp. BJB300]
MKLLKPALLAIALANPLTIFAAVPTGYSASYQSTIDAAGREGKLTIYATTDIKLVQPLIADFRSLYPGVQVEYNDVNSTELFNRYVSETAAGGASADVLWSSAMDMQVKLVNDGYALQYNTPEAPGLPEWAHWRNEIFGTTFEPVTIVYNKRLVAPADVPKTHGDLVKLLQSKPDQFRDKVTTYDVEKSGAGFLFATQDSKINPSFWQLAAALGATGVKLQSSTGTMMERISSGENLIGYNILGSYALTRAKKDPNIGVVLPTDYTVIISRLMMISKTAKSPNAAKLWVDYVLSKRGQLILSDKAELFTVRKDLNADAAGMNVYANVKSVLKPVPVGPGLLVFLDQAKRLDFMKQWRAATVRK